VPGSRSYGVHASQSTAGLASVTRALADDISWRGDERLIDAGSRSGVRAARTITSPGKIARIDAATIRRRHGANLGHLYNSAAVN